MDAINNLEDTRRCWRLVGGVLVERTVGEVKPSLKTNIDLVWKKIFFIKKTQARSPYFFFFKKVGKGYEYLQWKPKKKGKRTFGVWA